MTMYPYASLHPDKSISTPIPQSVNQTTQCNFQGQNCHCFPICHPSPSISVFCPESIRPKVILLQAHNIIHVDETNIMGTMVH